MYYKAAADAAPSLSWLYRIESSADSSGDRAISFAEASQLDGLERSLLSLGVMHSREYDKREADIRSGLANEHAFEAAHRMLGELLGFTARKVESQGSPDPWWRLADVGIWVFEEHAGAQANSRLAISKARQVATHENWIRGNLLPPPATPITQILITPVTKAEQGALVHLNNVKVWNLTKFRQWAESALSTLRELRKTLSEPGDLEWRASTVEILRQRRLTANSMVTDLPTGSQALSE